MNIEDISMNLIAHSGEARRIAFEALRKGADGDIEPAIELLKESEKEVILAHRSQTELLVSEAQGNTKTPSILLIHAQDHLMTCMLSIDLIREMLNMYRTVNELKGEK